MKPHERPHQISDEEFDREFLGSAVVGKDSAFAGDMGALTEERADERIDSSGWHADELDEETDDAV